MSTEINTDVQQPTPASDFANVSMGSGQAGSAIDEPTEMPCLFCAETVKSAAIKCRFCGETLSSQEAGAAPGIEPLTDSGPQTFKIREDERNGTVEIQADRIIRIRKKTVGKDDIQTIPIESISGIHSDRKTLGMDLVKLDIGAVSYEWKVSNAERMVALVHSQEFLLTRRSIGPTGQTQVNDPHEEMPTAER